MKKLLLVTTYLVMGTLVAPLVKGDTYFTNVNGNIALESSWDNGLPSVSNTGYVGSASSATNALLSEQNFTGQVVFFRGSSQLTRDLTTAQRISDSVLTFEDSSSWDMSGGDSSADALIIGRVNTATINWNSSGALSNIGSKLDLGYQAGDHGFFNQSAGSVSMSGYLQFRESSVYTLSGGTLSIGDDIRLNASATADAHINLLTTGTTGTITKVGGDYTTGFQGLIDDGRIRIDGVGQADASKFLITFAGGDTSITLDPNYTPPAATAFTDGNANGLWHEAGNWSDGVPSASLETSVNGDLAANLNGGSGDAKLLDVGTVDGESGTVSNGSLTVVNATQVGVASNAVGTLSLTSFSSTTATEPMSIGTGDYSSGSLVAGSGSVVGSTLAIGSGTEGTGTLDMGTGSVSFDTIEVAKGGSALNGTLSAANLTFGALAIGSSANSTGTVTASTFTQSSAGNVSVGYGANSLASFTGAGSLNAGVVAAGTGNGSSGTIDIGTGSVSVGTELRVGIAADASGELIASTVSIDSGKDIRVATAQNSTGTVSVSSITLPSTNGIFIGTGDNSSHNLTASDLIITEPIGDFGVGEGTGPSITGLFNTYNSYGSLTVNTPLTITAKDHQITALTLNADLTLGGTGGLVDGAGVTIAGKADGDVSFDFADWVSGVVTAGPITVASGDAALGSLVAADLVLDNTLQLGGSGSGSSGMVSVATLDGEGNNSKQVKIVEGTGIGSTGTVIVAGNARIDDTWVGSATEAVGALTVGGTLTITNGNLYVADGTDSQGTVDVTGAAAIKSVQVGEGVGSVGTANFSSLTITANGGLDLSAQNVNSTSTVTIAGNANITQLRAAIRNDSKAALIVGGTLEVRKSGNSYFNIGSADRVHAEISATTINKIPTNGLSIAKGGAVDAHASVTATDGLLTASKLEVANASGAYGLLSIPYGTLTIHGGTTVIAEGANATGIVEIAIATVGESAVSVGAASNAVGSLTLTGSETLYASALDLGSTNSGSYGQGSVTLAGGDLEVSGADDIAEGSYINVVSDDSKLTLVGRTESDFEALWATGALRSNGESGLTGKAFNECFYVIGDTIAETPISFISIDNGVGGVDISWDSKLGQDYNIQTNVNLTLGTWGAYTSVVGTGTKMTVTVPASAGAVFYQVTAPITP